MTDSGMRAMQGTPDNVETTVEILDFSYDEVEERVALSRVTVDLLVHGTRDGSRVYVTASVHAGELKSIVSSLGLLA